MGGSNSKSKAQHGGDRHSLRNRVRHIIAQETADEQDEFKFIGLEHVVGQASGSTSADENQPNCCLRILWFILILACVITCVYQIWDRIAYFYTYPTYLSVTVEQRINISYPTVTICTDPGYTLRTRKKMAKMYGTKPCDYLDVDLVDYKLTKAKKTAESLWRGVMNAEGTIIRVDDLINIRFPIPKVELQEETFVKTPFGTCLQDKMLHPTIRYGGTLTAMVYLVTETQGCNSPFIIFGAQGHYLDPSGARPFPSGVMVSLPIKQQDFRGLSTPTNPCVSEEEYWNCIIPCYETLMATTIKCKLPYNLNVTAPYCNTSVGARSAHQEALKIMRSKYLDLKCSCPKRCDTSTYIIRLETITIFPSLLIIFFPTNYVEVSEEKYAYDFDKLICDIGGNLGLFLGFCLLSLMDSIQLFVDIVKSKLCRKRKRQVNPKAMATQQMGPQNFNANMGYANAQMQPNPTRLNARVK